MVLTRPTELHQHRARLDREPAAVAEARSQVRALICAWRVPVDPDITVLLTSDLVTNAMMHGTGETITLSFLTPAGKVAFFTLAFPSDLPLGRDGAAVGGHTCGA